MKALLQKPLLTLAALLALGGGAGIAALASAQTVTNADTATQATTSGTSSAMHDHRGPGVFGTIASISGNTITVTSKGMGTNTTETTYTVDATSAKVMIGKDGSAPATGALSDLKVGDTVSIRGTVSGTNVTATDIMDGVMGHGFGPGGHRGPGVMGTVSAVSGNTVTITNNDGTSYTIDASNAEVSKVSTVSVSDIKVGDTIGVDGTVSGTSVTAKHIMDGVPPQPQAPPTQTQ